MKDRDVVPDYPATVPFVHGGDDPLADLVVRRGAAMSGAAALAEKIADGREAPTVEAFIRLRAMVLDLPDTAERAVALATVERLSAAVPLTLHHELAGLVDDVRVAVRSQLYPRAAERVVDAAEPPAQTVERGDAQLFAAVGGALRATETWSSTEDLRRAAGNRSLVRVLTALRLLEAAGFVESARAPRHLIWRRTEPVS